MNNLEIDKTLRNDPYAREIYAGTFALDRLPNPLQPGRIYVFNLDDSS